MTQQIYLDHAATTPLHPEVWEAMTPYATEVFGNASGGHSVSRAARGALEEARERVAACLGAEPREIVFTSGGTESDNLAVKGRADVHPGTVVVSAVEHEAVEKPALRAGRGRHVAVPVDGAGRVDPERVAESAEGAAVVSVMFANNETGTIQPIREVVDAVAGRTIVHTDAVQAFATIALDVAALGVDLLSLSAHKFGGPKGIGILYVREGVELAPVLDGGGQELGRRSGTSNVMGAVGMAAAMELTQKRRDEVCERVMSARDRFEADLDGVAVPTVPDGPRLASHAHLRFPGFRNETLMIRIDRAGVAASVGSACASGAASVSPVLEAMGMDETAARETLRFSFGWTSTLDDAITAAALIRELAS